MRLRTRGAYRYFAASKPRPILLPVIATVLFAKLAAGTEGVTKIWAHRKTRISPGGGLVAPVR